MTEGEDTAVKDGHQKISPCCIITAKSRDQRQGDDVDDIDGDHGTDGAGGVDFRTLLDVLGQGAAERQRTDHGVIDGIPEAGDQHQEGHCRHADAADIGVKNHQEVANEHPAEVAAHIAHAVSDFTDQRDFDVRILLFRLCCVTHTARSFLLLTRCL